MSFFCDLRQKVNKSGHVHIGMDTDPDDEDDDDACALLKAVGMMQLLNHNNPDLQVTFHLQLDTNERVFFTQKVLGPFCDVNGSTLEIKGANLRFELYKFPITDDTYEHRRAEVKRRMDKALHQMSDTDGQMQKAIESVKFQDPATFPWEILDAYVVAASMYGLNMNNITKMPKESPVLFTGDGRSVNARPREMYDAMLQACTKFENKWAWADCQVQSDTEISSRFYQFPPVDPEKNDGFTRQCRIGVGFMELFCVLSQTHESAAVTHAVGPSPWKGMAQSLGNAMCRFVCNRPDEQPEQDRGKLTRNRLNVSNARSLVVMNDLNPNTVLKIRVRNGDKELLNEHRPNNLDQLQAMALSLVSLMNLEVFISSSIDKSQGKLKELNLTLLFNSYVNKCNWNEDDNEKFENSVETEKNAIMSSVLATMILFGNVFGPPPSIKAAPEFQERTVAEVISGFQSCNPDGEITGFSPDYDAVVTEAAMLHCFNVIPLGQYTHKLTEEGHMIMCHQKEEVINAYIAREKQIMQVLMESQKALLRLQKVSVPVSSFVRCESEGVAGIAPFLRSESEVHVVMRSPSSVTVSHAQNGSLDDVEMVEAN